jgi:hypothetical protein
LVETIFFAGFCLLCTAFTNAASAYFQEVVTPNPKEPPMTQLSNLCSIQHCCSDVASTGKYQTVDDQRTEAEEGSFATFITNIRYFCWLIESSVFFFIWENSISFGQTDERAKSAALFFI